MKKTDVKDGDIIAVWFSCGAASAVAAKKVVEEYGNRCTIRILNNPIQEEHIDNQRFLKDVEVWIGHNIEHVKNSKFPNMECKEVWDKRRYMSGIGGAPCTQELKKNARIEWENSNDVDWHVLGFTYDEKKRSDNFMKTERSNLIPILIEQKINREDCFKILMDDGIRIPEMYLLGYPNANCIGCVKATSATYWNHVRKNHPDVFKDRAEQSRRLGVKLARYKGKRLFLDELPEDAVGQRMKNMDFECGIFCEESQ